MRRRRRRKDDTGFAYAYNVANVDPQPFFHEVEKRIAELKEDFRPDDYLKMLRYIAELELKNEAKKEKPIDHVPDARKKIVVDTIRPKDPRYQLVTTGEI